MAAAPLQKLDALARLSYRDLFYRAVAEHRVRPLVLPYALLAPMALPALWLTIPHTKRPWVYRTRWLVAALIVAMNLDIILGMSSYNVACAYGAGLMGFWGILQTLDLLIWSRPQFDAARIVKVDNKPAENVANGHSKAVDNITPKDNGLSHQVNVPSPNSHETQNTNKEPEYVWQPFPENTPFLQRLNWTMDFITNYRCIGWNCSITSVPRPKIPARIRPGDHVSLNELPVSSRAGFKRSLTESEFVWSRVRSVVVQYFVLDFLAVTMVKDPYFVFGPERYSGLELPWHLSQLPPWALVMYRQLYSLAGIYVAIGAIFTLHDLFQYYVFSYFFPVRSDIWQYTTIWGPFSQILDRGLAGWWGGFWHQTFRLQFSSPATYMIRRGYLTKGSLAAQIATMLVSFLQSGLLHASGSISSMPDTKAWRSPVFFLLQIPGILIQTGLLWVIDNHLPGSPKASRRIFNFVFTFVWLHMTSTYFCDDIASSGLWLLEPIPFSPLRLLGLGQTDDNAWRWTKEVFPTWHLGEHWWTSGLQI